MTNSIRHRLNAFDLLPSDFQKQHEEDIIILSHSK